MNRIPRIEAEHPEAMRFARFSGRYDQLLRDHLTENAASLCIKYARAHRHDLPAVAECAERVLENHPEDGQRMMRFLTEVVWRQPGAFEVQAIRMRFLGREEEAERLERFKQEVDALIDLNMMAEAARLFREGCADLSCQREVLGHSASVVTLAEKEEVWAALARFEDYVREVPRDHGMRQRSPRQRRRPHLHRGRAGNSETTTTDECINHPSTESRDRRVQGTQRQEPQGRF